MLLFVANLVLASSPAAAQPTPEVVLAGKRYELTPVAEPIVVRSRADERTRSELQRLASDAGAAATSVLDDYVIIEGARSPGALARDLLASRHADDVLAVFETENRIRLYADRHVRVRFGDQTSEARMRELVAAAGASAPRIVSSIRNTYDVLAASAEASLDVAHALGAEPEVLWAHPDFIVQATLAFVPDDPLYPQQWHHEILDSGEAWDIGQGSPATIIAIIDSGTDTTHPELAAKIVSPRDTLRDVDGADPAENDAHGTACAGIAAALFDNATGIAGVCPSCSLMPVRVLDQNGFSRVSSGADGLRWAVDHGARVLSNSWGISPVSDELAEALDYARTSGALVLFASGNDGKTITDDMIAANPSVHAIGATNQYDLLAGYSNTGPQIAITGPAASVVTDIADRRGYTSGAYFSGFAGTSAATPVVAGVAALVWSAQPSLTGDQVLQLLGASADRIGNTPYVDGRNDLYGAGRVNAHRAMLLAAQMTPCVPTPELCGNAIDDDCDGLVDLLDPQCAPADVPIGDACTRDFQCGVHGYCLEETLGFPGGYCSEGCTGTGSACPDGSVCVGEGFTTGSSCHVQCDSTDDCRPGYECLTFSTQSTAKACLPSCNLSDCLPGEVCNPTTGVCQHDGPSPIGGPCTTRVDCADNGRCLPDAQGFRDGICVTECQDDGQCAEGTFCLSFSAGQAFCLPTCLSADDCREFYACHPVSASNGVVSKGYCFDACLSASDCGYQTCNHYGLCGDETPPNIIKQPANTGDPDPSADDSGCAATSAPPLLMLAGLAMLRRRSRSAA